MPTPSHSISKYSACYLALTAFVCVVVGLLSGSAPALLAGTDWSTRQFNNLVAQIEAPNHTASPIVCLDSRLAGDVPNQLMVEPASPADDDEADEDEADEDETKSYILPSHLAAFRSPTSPYESSAARAALTPFRLLAFSNRGSPSA